MRMAAPCRPAASTTARTWASLPMVPGLMRTAAAPASRAAQARRQSKWMSATIGTGAWRTTSVKASTSAAAGSVTRTSSLPAAASAPTCSRVAAASPVGVLVMDCTTTGAPPPTATAPTRICRTLLMG